MPKPFHACLMDYTRRAAKAHWRLCKAVGAAPRF